MTITAADRAAAGEVGVDPILLAVVRSVESSGHPEAVRFEPQLFNRITSRRYASHIPYTPSSDTSAIDRISADTNRDAFEHARGYDARAAVRASSWGSYQVLGRHLLAVRGVNPDRASPAQANAAVAAFDADPEGVSQALVVRYIQTKPGLIEALRAHNWPLVSQLYNGAEIGTEQNAHYAGRLQDAYQRLSTSAAPTFGGADPSTVSEGGTYRPPVTRDPHPRSTPPATRTPRSTRRGSAGAGVLAFVTIAGLLAGVAYVATR